MSTVESKALEANLVVTKAEEIKLPENYQWLLNQSSDYYGIHKRTEQFFQELYHPYVNIQDVIDLFQQTIINDLWFYLDLPENSRALREILNLFIRIKQMNVISIHKKRLLQCFFDFLRTVAEHNENKLPDEVVEFLFQWHQEDKELFIYSCGMCRKVLAKISSGKYNETDFFAFQKELLKDNLEYWKDQSKPLDWLTKKARHNLSDFNHIQPLLGKAYYESELKKLEETGSFEELYDIPSYHEIAVHHRKMVNHFKSVPEKIHYILYLLSLSRMTDLHEYLLWDMNKLLGETTALKPEEIKELIKSVFQILSDFRETHPSIVLDCVLTIGKIIHQANEEELFKDCINRIVNLGFIPPGKMSIEDNWQIRIDKNHVKNIRVWLSLIRIKPEDFKDLLAALTVALIRKGVLIFDTDLFQKDVSTFVNSEIAPCFVQTKQLLRLLPVFFSEIGAEGEIRDLSTVIDEVTKRNDRLIHFFRKMIHAESNNTHVILARQILCYWHDIDIELLQGLIPQDIFESLKKPDKHTKDINGVLKEFLKRKEMTIAELLVLPKQDFAKLFKGENVDECVLLKKIFLLCKIYYLLLEKYQLDSFDVVRILQRSPFYSQKDYVRLYRSLIKKDYDGCIRVLYHHIEKLNSIILNPQESQGWENIYFKRHIAAGIPSMYGTYREAKFEAIGLIFRLESVIKRLIEKNIAQINLNYITAKTLKRIIRILDIFYQGLKLERINNEGLFLIIQMLRSGYRITNLTIEQYLDIFNRIKDSIDEIINEYYYRFYDHTIFEHNHNSTDSTENNNNNTKAESKYLLKEKQKDAEETYRNLLSSSFLIQQMDNFISQVLLSLKTMKNIFRKDQINKVMTYDPDVLFVPINEKNARLENQILLGSKGYFLKKMFEYGLPVPSGVIITTELFRYRSVIRAHPQIYREFDNMIKENINRLEKLTNMRYGDPKRPLLLSVRSGAPMSLPGAMNTFLNVGMNDDVADNLSKQPNFAWTAWDSYRRFIQSWGMAYGIPRDDFDVVMLDFKKRFGVSQKTDFEPEQMRDMTQQYKEVLQKNNIRLDQDLHKQLKLAVLNVLDSWNSDRAKLYREKLQIADEWGTAIIIQKMVFGNISLESGSGVVFTYSDRVKQPGIHLNGDFTVCSQGEDVVAGLVHTLPVSEHQRVTMKPEAEYSLEKQFPLIYKRLLNYANYLLKERDYPHQEIEFTFEGSNEDQLFLLQTRDQIIRKQEEHTVFNMSGKETKLIGQGIGISKGAINGRIVFSHEEIKQLQREGDPLILVKPDTVPDDMDLLFECQGLLTARGGITSHAAVTASSLGLVGVVNCRGLMVFEEENYCRIGGVRLKTGEKIAIDGNNGNIYLGHYPVERIKVLH